MNDYVEQKVKSKVEKFVKSAVKVIFMILLFALFILAFGYVFMLLWNWLMPTIFDLTTITYWQAVGILVLAKMLFGGFGNHNPKNGKHKNGKRNCRPGNKLGLKTDFSRWKHYEAFWKEEGELAYKEYIARKTETPRTE
ncbi:RnfABCDGE type electron transport complex subunit D [Pareuzebyella sediminis]|uniref:RnfABCDGE type electron transport complex subunit D n=1 Tax=Pareuzebyella sediminis TaxID=2607998 RepID=UPI0011ED0B24|nr:RnfABCDGE type electron transport complex subunit D [Pareuzebyella sediminis]